MSLIPSCYLDTVAALGVPDGGFVRLQSRFPSEVISHTAWLHHRCTLSFRDAEDLLAGRGVTVSHKTVRFRCREVGPAFARDLHPLSGLEGRQDLGLGSDGVESLHGLTVADRDAGHAPTAVAARLYALARLPLEIVLRSRAAQCREPRPVDGPAQSVGVKGTSRGGWLASDS